jgi:hypothetical protein
MVGQGLHGMDQRRRGEASRTGSSPAAAAGRPRLLRPAPAGSQAGTGGAGARPRRRRVLLLPLLVHGPPGAASAGRRDCRERPARFPLLPVLVQRRLDARLGRAFRAGPAAAALLRGRRPGAHPPPAADLGRSSLRTDRGPAAAAGVPHGIDAGSAPHGRPVACRSGSRGSGRSLSRTGGGLPGRHRPGQRGFRRGAGIRAGLAPGASDGAVADAPARHPARPAVPRIPRTPVRRVRRDGGRHPGQVGARLSSHPLRHSRLRQLTASTPRRHDLRQQHAGSLWAVVPAGAGGGGRTAPAGGGEAGVRERLERVGRRQPPRALPALGTFLPPGARRSPAAGGGGGGGGGGTTGVATSGKGGGGV